LGPEDQLVTEESPLNPQSLYAETKIASEKYLLDKAPTSPCVPVLFRFATLFGISPRTRFDLIVNQFVLEALTQRKLIIYQRGYVRSFVHVRDVCRAVVMGLEADAKHVGGHVFNVGSETGNYSKDEIVRLVQQHVRGTEVHYKDLSFGGDMRDIRVSFAKIRSRLGFEPQITVEQGIIEVRDAIESGLVGNALSERHRNAQFIVQ
jgi:nucleoside-diphosphate-sugar epimerase